MTKIDILLPYWGEFSLLKKTVDSVLTQTSHEWHLYIFDDHYPSLEAQQYYTNLNDPRITYYRHEKNIGITHNFNYALEVAQNPYLMLLGCDDLLLPDFIATALRHVDSCDFYQPRVEVIGMNGDVYKPLGDRVKALLAPKKSGHYKGEWLASSLCTGNWLYFPAIVWKTDVIKRYMFDTSYTIVEDVVLELTMIIDGATLYVDTDKPTFQYRRFAASLSSKEKSKGGVRFTEEASVYSHFANQFKAIGWKKAAFAARLRLTSRIHQILS